MKDDFPLFFDAVRLLVDSPPDLGILCLGVANREKVASTEVVGLTPL